MMGVILGLEVRVCVCAALILEGSGSQHYT